MTPSLALIHLTFAAAAKTTKTNPLIALLPFVLIAVAGYFFFIKPQQRKAAAARATVNSDIEVGDDVQTIGGVIGTVLEIHGDRYTLLTGALGPDGNLDGPQPTRIVFVRAAIARKVDRVVDVDDIGVEDHSDHTNSDHTAVEDDGPTEAAHDEHSEHIGDEGAEEA
jgi:preprotein translocase YajC subunit